MQSSWLTFAGWAWLHSQSASHCHCVFFVSCLLSDTQRVRVCVCACDCVWSWLCVCVCVVVCRALCWSDEASRSCVNWWWLCRTTPVTLSTWSAGSYRSILTAVSRLITVAYHSQSVSVHLWSPCSPCVVVIVWSCAGSYRSILTAVSRLITVAYHSQINTCVSARLTMDGQPSIVLCRSVLTLWLLRAAVHSSV